jgi:hypothetical protein
MSCLCAFLGHLNVTAYGSLFRQRGKIGEEKIIPPRGTCSYVYSVMFTTTKKTVYVYMLP